jgi:hypothetical protein
MKVNNLKPNPIKKVNFEYAQLKLVPESLGCYVLCSYMNDIIYIGQAVNLRKRLLQHFDSEKRTEITEFGKIFYVFYIELKIFNDINTTERGWLTMHELETGSLPPLNKVRSPVS